MLLWTPKRGQRSREIPAKPFVDQMVEDTKCEVDELINLMDNRDEWKKRVLECRASSTWIIDRSGVFINNCIFMLYNSFSNYITILYLL